jgi:hypothetical protein
MQLDAELLATGREPVALVRADARKEGHAIAEARRGGRRVGRGAADAPLGIALELVARRVSDRDQVEHHTLKRT